VPGPLLFLAIGTSLGWFFLAAKVHGRQIRLERELEGFTEVAFGRNAHNPAWVEALWRADRISYWIRVPIAALVLVSYVLVADARGWPRPLGDVGPAAASTLVGMLWAPSVGFLLNGLGSLRRFGRARRRPEAPGPGGDRGAWLRAHDRGTRLYWAAAIGGGVVVTTLAFV
jgi:hypothetical protein